MLFINPTPIPFAVSGLIPDSPLLCTILLLIIVSVGVALHRIEWIRRAALGVLLYGIVAAGLTGQFTWPFFNWHLYGFRASPELSFHEFRVADTDGNELRFDARAVKPSLQTPLRRYAGGMKSRPAHEQQAMADFLLARARDYRLNTQSPVRLAQLLKFPPHQIGVKWTRKQLDRLSEFSELRVYRVDCKLNPDGSEVLAKSEELVGQYR